MINDQRKYEITSKKYRRFSGKILERISCNQKNIRRMKKK